MAWSYTGLLATNDRDLVRFLLGDVVVTSHSPQDGEVDYWITANINPATGKTDAYKAASEIASAMANRFQTTRATALKMGGMSIQYNYAELATQYRDLAARLLEGRTATTVGGPVWDTTIASSFSMGMMDHL